MTSTSGQFVKVAKVAEIPPGSMKIVKIVDLELSLALCNVDGQVYAIENVCTHDGGTLGAGELEGYVVECPRHGARFDVRTGAVLAMPAVIPVETYPVRLDGDSIEVDVSRVEG